MASAAAAASNTAAPADLPGSDLSLLARIGDQVRTRLDANPAAERMPAFGVDMYVVHGFLSAEECAALVEMVGADVQPSTVFRATADPDYRTSETCNLPRAAPLVHEVEQRMADLLGIALAHSETLQGQRYLPGQQFKAHGDYFTGGKDYSQMVAAEGGQRTWTAMVFLDEPAAGGATHFARAGVRVPPRTGTLLTWNNLDRDGHPNRFTRHEGTRVEKGAKHVLTKWFREREWRKQGASEAFGS